MENGNIDLEIDARLETLASKITDLRNTPGSKRPRFPQEIKDEVSSIVASGIKVHRVCKKTRLGYSAVLRWTGNKSKFKPLKIVRARKKSHQILPKEQSPFTIRLPSGAELKGIRFDELASLLDQGLL